MRGLHMSLWNYKDKHYHTPEEYEAMVEQIAYAVQNNSLVIFIGAGVPRIQGYLDWNGYVDHLIKYWQFNIKKVAKREVPKRVTYAFDELLKLDVSNKRKVDLLYEIIRRNISEDINFWDRILDYEKVSFEEQDPGEPLNTILLELTRLKASFITTNYDFQIEKHMEKNGLIYNRYKDIESFVEDEYQFRGRSVLHMHGTPSGNPKFFVNSSESYVRMYHKRREHINKLAEWLRKKETTILFFGSSMEEDEILSLLFEENSHYAFLRAKVNEEKMGGIIRDAQRDFFRRAHNVNVFWYGDEFSDLLSFVERMVDDVQRKIDVPELHEDWNVLLSNKVSKKDVLAIFDKYNSSGGVEFLNDFFRILPKSQVAGERIHHFFESKVARTELVGRLDSLWEYLDNNFENLKDSEIEILSNYFATSTFPCIVPTICKLLESKAVQREAKKEIIINISRSQQIEYTNVVLTDEIYGWWIAHSFENKMLDFRINIPEGARKVDLTEDSIQVLHDSISNKYAHHWFSPITKVIETGAEGLLYTLLKEDKLTINGESWQEAFPDMLFSLQLVQKILVYLVKNKNVGNYVIDKLIEHVDFSNRLIGEEFNEFTNKYRERILEIKPDYEPITYLDAIGNTYVGWIEDSSKINLNQFISLSENDIVKAMIEAGEKSLTTAEEGTDKWTVRSIKGTTDAFIEFLQSTDEYIMSKARRILLNSGNRLLPHYQELYTLAIKNASNLNLADELKCVVGVNLDKSIFDYQTSKYFEMLFEDENVSCDDMPAFFSFDIHKLSEKSDIGEASSNIMPDVQRLLNCDLGRYFFTMEKIDLKLHPVSNEIERKVLEIKDGGIRSFFAGIFYELFSVSEKLLYNEFELQGISWRWRLGTKDAPKYVGATKKVLRQGYDDSAMDANIAFVALNHINPANESICSKVRFSSMIRIIFSNEVSYKYEEDWIKHIFSGEESRKYVEMILLLFNSKYSYDKLKSFVDKCDEWLSLSTSPVKLNVITTNRIGEESPYRALLLQFLQGLLDNNRINRDSLLGLRAEELVALFPNEQRRGVVLAFEKILQLLEYERLCNKFDLFPDR